jgi:iron-sulfur cluster assembly accessory protein
MNTGNGIVVTANAAERIASILKNEPQGTMLRISVTGGGCSGFQYNYDLVKDLTEDDLVAEKDGIKVLVDSVSIMYMDGAELDFVDGLIGQSFQINNPNAVAGCGCGTSFSI